MICNLQTTFTWFTLTIFIFSILSITLLLHNQHSFLNFQSTPTTTTTDSIFLSKTLTESFYHHQINATLLLQLSKSQKYYLIGCQPKSWEQFVLKEFYYLFNELLLTYHWIEPSELAINNLLKKSSTISLDKIPDVILFCEHGIDKYFNVSELNQLKIRKSSLKLAFWCDDIHQSYLTKRLNDVVNNVDAILSTYAYLLYDMHLRDHLMMKNKNLPKFIWIPHGASIDFIKSISWNANPINKVLLAGSTRKYFYPIRYKLKRKRKKLQFLAYYKHPGYRRDLPIDQSQQFAKHIQLHLATFTCGSIYNYMVAKIFEIPSTGSLLLLNEKMNLLMMSLGFTPNVHFISYNDTNPLPTLKWIVDSNNRQMIDKIRRNGMKFIRSNHTIYHRAYAIHAFFVQDKIIYSIPKVFKT